MKINNLIKRKAAACGTPRLLARHTLLSIFALSLCSAQNLEKVLPEPVPQLVEPAEEGTSRESAVDEVDPETLNLGARPGEEVIIAELKGIRILSDPTDVEPRLSSLQTQIEIQETASLRTQTGIDLLSLALDLPASQASLERLQLAIRLALAQNGRAFSIVYIPPQDVTEGYLQIVVVESTVGEIRVEGNEYFSDASYLSRFGQTPGEAVDGRALATGVDRINQNSFRNAATRVEKGSEPGTTDIVIQAKERRPIRLFTGYNNTGTQTTTEDRMFAGFNWGNAFGLGHQMTMQWTSDLDIEHSKALSGNYTADLPHNHSVTLFGAYSEIVSVPNGGLDQEGTSWQAGVNYDIPLEDIGAGYSHSVQLGFDFKSSDNNLELTLPPFIIPISDNLTHVAQFRAQYRGTLKDVWGSTGWGVKVTASPGDLSSKNDDEDYGASRSGARADYVYGNLDAFRSTHLRGFLTGWDWNLRGELQLSNRNLLGSEQFSAGGSQSVRGYEESEVVGDNALFLSQELLLPAWDTSLRLPGKQVGGVLRTFVFQDYARTWNVDKLPGEKAFNVHSVGAGLRLQIEQNLTASIAYGWQIRDSGSSDTGDNSRAHISVQFSY